MPQTKLLIDFFKVELNFRDEEILYISEIEAKQLEILLNQSIIFKTFNSGSQEKITKFARQVFFYKNKKSNGRELLTIFLNESTEPEVVDFVIKRNAELALNVLPIQEKESEETKRIQMEKYLKPTKKVMENFTLVKFENLHRLFLSMQNVVTFCTQQDSFKPGSGHFDYIYKLNRKGTQTIKQKINFLEKLPVRYFQTS